jgi:RNA polymerase sigma factor (sigma-70 family)
MIRSSIYKRNLTGKAPLDNAAAVAACCEYQRTKDKRALDAVVAAHYGLALHFVQHMRRSGAAHIDEDDLVQEALAGLWEGLQRFDPTRQVHGKPVKIATYVSWYIRMYLTRYQISAYRTTTLHQRQADRLFWRARRLHAVRAAQGLDVTAETMAKLLGVKLTTYEVVTSWMGASEVSASALAYRDGDVTVGDTIVSPDPCAIDTLADVDVVSKIDVIAQEFREPLRPLPRDVFDVRIWNLHDDVLPTLDEVGQRHQRTRERVRQVEVSLRAGFRERLDDAGLLDSWTSA